MQKKRFVKDCGWKQVIHVGITGKWVTLLPDTLNPGRHGPIIACSLIDKS